MIVCGIVKYRQIHEIYGYVFERLMLDLLNLRLIRTLLS